MAFANAFNWQRLLTKTLKTPANLGFDQNGITRLHAKNKASKQRSHEEELENQINEVLVDS